MKNKTYRRPDAPARKSAPVLVPKKHLGQNFLVDQRVVERILDAIDIQPEDTVLEIGPGPGVLTGHLASRAGCLIGVETDRDLCAFLRQTLEGRGLGPVADHPVTTGISLIQDDILRFDFAALPPGTRLVGNLPYNISTPILERVIEHRAFFREAFLTVQWEFGRRLAAKPGGKDYGALSCFAQYAAEVRVLFKIPPQAFKPQPKVTSCLVHLKFRPADPLAGDEILLGRLVRQAFSQRRKKISNVLAPVTSEAVLSSLFSAVGIDPHARPETLSVADYTRLINAALPIRHLLSM